MKYLTNRVSDYYNRVFDCSISESFVISGFATPLFDGIT